jgi:lipoate-protein ligase A
MIPLRFSPDSSVPYPTGEDVIDPQGPGFRAWIPQTSILVLGNSQKPEIELNLGHVAADTLPVYQRKGGGGAVLLTGGCVCVAWRMEKRAEWSIADYFGAGNGLVTRVLRDAYGIEALPRGISDLAVETRDGVRKISGSSLYMPRECALYLVSILVDARIADWDRYLAHPSREPDYRGGRKHEDFVTNLASLNPGITPENLREQLEREAGTGISVGQ